MDRYDEYTKASRNCFLLLSLSAVIYGAVILMEVVSQKKKTVGEYDFVEEDYDPNDCGIFNHKILSVIAIMVKAFPLWYFTRAISKGETLRNLYNFLTTNLCSDKITNKKIGEISSSVDLIHSIVFKIALAIVFSCLLEFYPFFYSLEAPIEEINEQNQYAAS